MFELTVISKDINEVNHLANEFCELLKPHFPNNILGPEFPLISKIKNQYYKRLLIKTGKQQPAIIMREKIYSAINDLKNKYKNWKYRIAIDVDPV